MLSSHIWTHTHTWKQTVNSRKFLIIFAAILIRPPCRAITTKLITLNFKSYSGNVEKFMVFNRYSNNMMCVWWLTWWGMWHAGPTNPLNIFVWARRIKKKMGTYSNWSTKITFRGNGNTPADSRAHNKFGDAKCMTTNRYHNEEPR